MPVKTPASSLRGTSPSKAINEGSKNSWGAQTGTTDPKQAIKDKHTNDPVKVGGN